MTTVIVLSDCPPKLRGDMTKWMMEINTGVYVGNLNARVREELWQRVRDHIKHGKATMVFRAGGEQRMAFRVHNTTWEPVDYDGITLMRRPSEQALRERPEPSLPPGFSKAARSRKAHAPRNKRREIPWSEYVALDLETTALRPEAGRIIEIGAALVLDGAFQEEWSALISSGAPVPAEITDLTGITNQMLEESGIPLKEALERLADFLEDLPVIFHNLPFDMAFLNAACQECGLALFGNPGRDTLDMARKRIQGVSDYKLGTLARHLNLETGTLHRALADCRLTALLYEKLKKMDD